ncbi:MAG: hypothetical protein KC543_03460 [Myxococcales bacterium]|nr:hypothetical protein [Myxococcales bacterium]
MRHLRCSHTAATARALGASSRALALAGVAVVALGGCDHTKRAPEPQPVAEKAPPRPAPTVPTGAQQPSLTAHVDPRKTPDPPSPNLDAQGDLVESSVEINGVHLPEGFERLGGYRQSTYFATRAPARKVVKYFGDRLFTGNVQALDSGGAIYRNARSRHATKESPAMDVAIYPSNQGARVTFHVSSRKFVGEKSQEEINREYREAVAPDRMVPATR